MPSISALDWKADALVDLDEQETETDDPDWDDVAILIGSEIVRDVRAAVRERLKYTCVSAIQRCAKAFPPFCSHPHPVVTRIPHPCLHSTCTDRLALQSAGVAQNKMLAKLGSGSKKPNGQTVVRNRALTHFLSGFKVTKIRNLGGKLGDQVVQTFGTESVSELLQVPVEQLKLKLGDDTGVWVYNTIRGIDQSEVNSRVQIKSMLSAKSFRPSINSVEQAVKWLRIFVNDIFSRLVEEGVLENKRRPRTINLHHRHGGQTKSRQAPIPQGKQITKETLLDLAKHLLTQVVLEGRAWPCANLSLSVGGFDEGVTGNMGIGAFLVKGEEARALKRSSREGSSEQPPEKQSNTRKKPGIKDFFAKQTAPTQEQGVDKLLNQEGEARSSEMLHDRSTGDLVQDQQDASGRQQKLLLQEQPITPYMCDRCRVRFESAEDFQCHQDEHLAWDLQKEEEEKEEAERGRRTFVGNSAASAASSSLNTGGGRGDATSSAAARAAAKAPMAQRSTAASTAKSKKKVEAGQQRLNFG